MVVPSTATGLALVPSIRRLPAAGEMPLGPTRSGNAPTSSTPSDNAAATAAATSDPPTSHPPPSACETATCGSSPGTPATAECMFVASVGETPAGPPPIAELGTTIGSPLEAKTEEIASNLAASSFGTHSLKRTCSHGPLMPRLARVCLEGQSWNAQIWRRQGVVGHSVATPVIPYVFTTGHCSHL